MFSKNEKILYSSVIILLLLFILSFTKSCTNTDKREILKTALINPKYSTDIQNITLVKDNETLLLTKTNDFWIVSENINSMNLPVDSKRINNLLKDMTSVRNLYKLSNKLNKSNSYGLQDSNTFTFNYTFTDGSHSIYFGNQDFAQTSRYLLTDKNTIIYEIDSSLDKYLTTNISNWAEPFLISQEVLGKITETDVQSVKVTENNINSSITDISKFLELRHGGLPDFSIVQADNLELTVSLEIGNKTEVISNIYSTNLESEYIVYTTYIKNDKSQYKTCTKISSWTYNKIKEITL